MTLRPILRLLDEESVKRIIDTAWEVLERTGVELEHPAALGMVEGRGFRTDRTSKRVFFDRGRAEPLLGAVPRSFSLFGRDGSHRCTVGEDEVLYDPGSAAVYVLEPGTDAHRRALSRDCRDLARLAEVLEMYPLQSTGLVPSDVPEPLADCHRLIFSLVFCSKPIITGTFRRESFAVMKAMLEAVAGGAGILRERPIAVFDCCPSPPLRWSALTLSALLDCAAAGIPAEIVSMPLAGATAPVTLEGAVVQHTAESLSGAVLHQMAGPGSPIVWGGSPAAFDMRHGTPPMGAMETMMIDLTYGQVGKFLGFPTHAYMACSDAKTPDYQAGMESGMGALLAALGGINIVSGPGFLNYENTQSLEKLVLDNDACRLAHRLVRGFDTGHADIAGIIHRHAADGAFLGDPDTRRHHRDEIIAAGRTVNRGSVDEWARKGHPTARDIAREEMERLLSLPAQMLDGRRTSALKAILIEEAEKMGCGDQMSAILESEIPPC